jgi:hypothetical protein
MAFSQEQLDALEAAIAEGALVVKYADKQITYRSLSEMMQIRDMIRRKLGLLDSGAGRIYPSVSKGTA